MKMDIKIFDSTLRDGSHAMNQQFTEQNITDYCKMVDEVGFYTTIVGHGNGLGASSLQVGESLLDDHTMLKTAKKYLKKTKLGAFLMPGFGTIHDNLIPAFEDGVDLVCIASHCTEADVTRQHIEFTCKEGKEAIGILMLQHTIRDKEILEQAKKMESYGAKGIIYMDSAGAALPEDIKLRMAYCCDKLSIPIGFHAHNNLGLAVSNSVEAVKGGAKIIDGTIRGFGAGAGNCQLEVFCAVIQKMGIPMDVDWYKAMDISDDVVKDFTNLVPGIAPINLISGFAGVFSSYAPHVAKAAKLYGVDSRDIFIELGRRKTVGGQEDIIIEAAAKLAEQM